MWEDFDADWVYEEVLTSEQLERMEAEGLDCFGG
jgi:hypothetical protein